MIARLIDRFGRVLTDRQASSHGPFKATDTAVLVLSPQVDLFSDNSAWTKLCAIRPSWDKPAAFLRRCREQGWSIYHSPMALSTSDEQSAIDMTRHLQALRSHGLLRQGEPGTKIEEAMLSSNDVVLSARRGLNAFVATGLRERLRQDRRSRLIMIGGVANADMDSSARAAVEYDFDVTVIADLTSAYSKEDWQNALEITLPRIVNRVRTSGDFDWINRSGFAFSQNRVEGAKR